MISGIGAWIEKIELCDGGDLGKLVNNAVATGCSWIAVKCGDSYNRPAWDDSYSELLGRALEADLKVYTWNDSKLSTWPAQIQLIVQQKRRFVAGHILKLGPQWTGQSKEAAAFLEALRKQVGPDFEMGAHVSHNINLHPTFPYQQFYNACQFLCSDLDWIKHGKKFEECAEMFRKNVNLLWKSSKEQKPFFPICNTEAKFDEFVNFIETYYNIGAFATWEKTSEDKFIKLAEIALKYDMGDEESVPASELTLDDASTPESFSDSESIDGND